MSKFMCTHSLPPHQLTKDQLNQLAQAAQHDPVIQGYRSFMNLSEGKIICIMEGPDRQSLQAWFQKMNVPVDSINEVEIEGDRGNLMDLNAEEAVVPAGATS